MSVIEKFIIVIVIIIVIQLTDSILSSTLPPMKTHFDIARGCTLECSACLDVLVARKRIDAEEAGKAISARIVSMLAGLVGSTSGSRLYENSPEYCAESE